MKIKVQNELFEVENDSKIAIEILAQQIEKLSKHDLFVGDVVIDGIVVSDDLETYIYEHVDDIEEIELVIITRADLINDMIESALDYLQRAIPETAVLADEFYRKPGEESWLKLSQLAEGVNWLAQFARSAHFTKLEVRISQIIDQLSDLESATVNQDFVLIGDLLLYEITPILEDIYEAGRNLRGTSHELN